MRIKYSMMKRRSWNFQIISFIKRFVQITSAVSIYRRRISERLCNYKGAQIHGKRLTTENQWGRSKVLQKTRTSIVIWRKLPMDGYQSSHSQEVEEWGFAVAIPWTFQNEKDEISEQLIIGRWLIMTLKLLAEVVPVVQNTTIICRKP